MKSTRRRVAVLIPIGVVLLAGGLLMQFALHGGAALQLVGQVAFFTGLATGLWAVAILRRESKWR